MSATLVLAAAQTIPVPGDVDANLARHIALARAAADEGASVLVFPELSLTGYELDLAERLAFSSEDARLDPLRGMALEGGMVIVAGAPLLAGSRLFLAAFVLKPDGTVELYTKRHLGAFAPNDNPGGAVPPPEASVFAPGSHDPLVRVGDRIAAVAVCADTGRPAHAQSAADRGASIYLASMFVIPPDIDRDTTRLSGYAERHAMAVVFSNYGGPSGGLPSGGRSAIWSDRGELLVQLGAEGSGLAVAVRDAGAWRGSTVLPNGV
jgi:predicted amidohydrolase